MNKRNYIAVLAAMGLAVSITHAEWGRGLNSEHKTIFIPMNQQSGWEYNSQITPAATAAEPAQALKNEPAYTPAAIPAGKWILEGVQFESKSDRLTPESKDSLNKAAQTLKDNPTKSVEIQGHTDNNGSDAYNLDLSQKRAEAVKAYLIEQGVEGERLQPKGFGKAHPIADNSTAEGRAQNRRIEFVVLLKQ